MYTTKTILLFFVFLYAVPSHALPTFFSAWQQEYPDSSADDSGCQLCHQSNVGNEPWNEYGWLIRNIYQANGFNITSAISTAESIDSDDNGVTNQEEIHRDFQPGWAEGSNNIVYYKNGTTEIGQDAPILPLSTGVDFPDEQTDPISDVGFGEFAIQLTEIVGGFNSPLKAVHAEGDDDSLFVIEQTGKIYKVDLDSGIKSLFYDVSADLVTINLGYDERGLLGLAFHPEYSANGLFYTYQSEPVRSSEDSLVDYSTTSSPNHRSMIVEHQVSNPSVTSTIVKIENLLIIDQPQGNHNGGDLAFGEDNYLYITLGDGGSAHDQGSGHATHGNGRDNTNPLGAILRIDVEGNNSVNGKYGIPNDNPFIGNADPAADEIFAYGFRNPYRFSFDAMTGELYAGDVGQGDVEEINIVAKGDNYGWNWKEGSFYFYNSISTGSYVSRTAPPGLPNNLIDPIAEYDHDDGISVTGGYVYRGTGFPQFSGRYIFADWNKRLFYLDEMNEIRKFRGAGINDFITGFGQDAENEIYILTNNAANPSGTEGKLLKVSLSLNADDDEICVPIKVANGNIALICL